MICMCSAIPLADFLRFFDDFGPDALLLIKAKLVLVSTEVWVGGIYQRDFSLKSLISFALVSTVSLHPPSHM